MDSRYIIFDPEDMDLEYSEHSDTPRKAARTILNMLEETPDGVVTTDRKYGIHISIIPEGPKRIRLAHRLHDSSWQSVKGIHEGEYQDPPQLETYEELEVFLNKKKNPQVLNRVLARRRSAEKKALHELGQAFRILGYTISTGGQELF